MAGIGFPTITDGTAMQEIVTAGGIVTGGIANEKKFYVTLELDQP